jgi:hypothetical protein
MGFYRPHSAETRDFPGFSRSDGKILACPRNEFLPSPRILTVASTLRSYENGHMKEPTTITKRNRAERRLSPESLVNILKSEPTRSAIHDGAGLYLDNRSNSRGTNGLRVGYWYHQYAEMDGGKRKPRTISIGPTDKVGAPSAPTRPATTDKAILKSTAATLVAARKRNDEIHDLRQSGLDPRAE